MPALEPPQAVPTRALLSSVNQVQVHPSDSQGLSRSCNTAVAYVLVLPDAVRNPVPDARRTASIPLRVPRVLRREYCVLCTTLIPTPIPECRAVNAVNQRF